MVHYEPMFFPYRIMNRQSTCLKSFTNEQVENKEKKLKIKYKNVKELKNKPGLWFHCRIIEWWWRRLVREENW